MYALGNRELIDYYWTLGLILHLAWRLFSVLLPASFFEDLPTFSQLLTKTEVTSLRANNAEPNPVDEKQTTFVIVSRVNAPCCVFVTIKISSLHQNEQSMQTQTTQTFIGLSRAVTKAGDNTTRSPQDWSDNHARLIRITAATDVMKDRGKVITRVNFRKHTRVYTTVFDTMFAVKLRGFRRNLLRDQFSYSRDRFCKSRSFKLTMFHRSLNDNFRNICDSNVIIEPGLALGESDESQSLRETTLSISRSTSYPSKGKEEKQRKIEGKSEGTRSISSSCPLLCNVVWHTASASRTDIWWVERELVYNTAESHQNARTLYDAIDSISTSSFVTLLFIMIWIAHCLFIVFNVSVMFNMLYEVSNNSQKFASNFQLVFFEQCLLKRGCQNPALCQIMQIARSAHLFHCFT